MIHELTERAVDKWVTVPCVIATKTFPIYCKSLDKVSKNKRIMPLLKPVNVVRLI
jgi:hypothetical protein